ncbi:MAG: S8 family serine peptidase [Acutalibacteraceae bacterium]|nr:S8 family serine peptidase [Acutalibacteraceae bacterium]
MQATAKKAYVEEIYYNPDTEEICENSFLTSNNVEKVHTEIGLTGNGVKAGIWEDGRITLTDNLLNSNIVDLSDDDDSSHKTNIAEIISGSAGIAPNVTLYSSSDTSNSAVEELISLGVSVINRSVGGNANGYTISDKWADHLVSQHNISLVKSAGNLGEGTGNITSPGKGYNVITVGRFDDNTENDVTDDSLSANSSYRETDNSCAKPDLVAYGPLGTSYAAPNVVATIALMLELKPSLAVHPEAIKAIVQSSCHRKVIATNDTQLSSGITDKQGAGAVDAFTAVCIVGNGQYITGTVDTTRSIVFEQPIYDGSEININLAWLIDSNFSENLDHTTGSPVIGDIHQLGMDVYVDGSYAASSDLSYIDETTNETVKCNSSTEMVTLSVTDTSSKLYNVRIYNSIVTDEEIPFAIAWSTDATPFNNNTSGDTLNGIYYVANKSAQDNLYPSTTANALISSTGINSWWILKKNANLTTYTLQTNSTSKPGYLAHGNSITNGYYSLVNQTTADNIYVVANSDGSFGLKQVISNTVYLLTYDETSDTVIWAASTGADTQKWYLNRINYYFGDVNYNGVIDSTDVTKLQNHIVGTTLLTRPAALYLADANQDGSINVKDTLVVQQYISNYAN